MDYWMYWEAEEASFQVDIKNNDNEEDENE